MLGQRENFRMVYIRSLLYLGQCLRLHGVELYPIYYRRIWDLWFAKRRQWGFPGVLSNYVDRPLYLYGRVDHSGSANRIDQRLEFSTVHVHWKPGHVILRHYRKFLPQ